MDLIRKRNKNVEMLRVISIILLVWYHVALIVPAEGVYEKIFRGMGRAGWVGTDVFLCVAGYYVALFFQRKGNTLSVYKAFVVDRMIRILPSYVFFLILYLTVGVYLQRLVGNDFELADNYLLYFLTFTTNFALMSGPYSGVALEGLFALSVGVQLSLFMGALLCTQKRKHFLLVLLIALELIAIITRWHFREHNHWFIYFCTVSRMDAFLGGIFLHTAYSYKTVRDFLVQNCFPLFCFSLGVLVMLALVTTGLSPWNPLTNQISYPLLAVILVLILNYTLWGPELWIAKIIGSYGELTYQVYLLKLPLVYFLYRILLFFQPGFQGFWMSVEIFVISVVVVFPVSAIWFRLLDSPVRIALRRRFSS